MIRGLLEQVMRLMTRDYAAAYKLAALCSTDNSLNETESWILKSTVQTFQDRHPEAAVCRMMLYRALPPFSYLIMFNSWYCGVFRVRVSQF